MWRILQIVFRPIVSRVGLVVSLLSLVVAVFPAMIGPFWGWFGWLPAALILIIALLLVAVISLGAEMYRLRPRLEILYDNSGYFERRGNFIDDTFSSANLRTFSVGVKNIGSETVGGCVLRLHSCIIGSSRVHVAQQQLPVGLQMRQQARGQIQTPFPLRPNEAKYADVVQCEEPKDRIEVLTSGKVQIESVQTRSLYLEIEALTSGGRGDRQWFYVYIDETGRLRFQRSSGPAADDGAIG